MFRATGPSLSATTTASAASAIITAYTTATPVVVVVAVVTFQPSQVVYLHKYSLLFSA